jgi:hypothetical protein
MNLINKPKYQWGPALWNFIHTISITNSIEQSNNIRNMLQHIYNIIPCPSCTDLYKLHLTFLYTIDLSQPLSLFKWSVDLHNAVNKKLNKPIWSFEDARKYWSIQVS